MADADENELYAALDWLRERQDAIEHRLAKRHLTDGARVLFDLSSSRDGVEWLTDLRSGAIRQRVDTGAIQMDLFDERDLFEFTCQEGFPDERLMACRNSQVAKLRA